MSKKSSELWHEFIHPKIVLCGLCGNAGIIDTRTTVQSHAGLACGIRAFCICPNGRAMKKRKYKL